MEILNKYLAKIRPIINARELERAAGLPANTLGKHYRFEDGLPHGQACSPIHFAAIVKACCMVFGKIEIQGWIISWEETNFLFIKPIPDRPLKKKEIKRKSAFEYRQDQWRSVVEEYHFVEFIKNA